MLPDYLLTRTLDPTTEMYEGDVNTALVRVIESLSATNLMLRALMLTEAGLMQQHAEGIHALIDQQCCMLTGIYIEYEDREARRQSENRRAASQISEEARKLREEFIASGAKAGAEAEMISEATNIPLTEIAAVMGRLRGERAPNTAAHSAKYSVAPRRASAQP